MKAIVINRFGPPEVFEEAALPRPAVGDQQVLVKVAASSVNPLDYKLRRGDFPHFAPAFPAVLHGDFAGTVVEVGRAVSAFKVGDEIYGCAGGVRGRQGALAEFMLVDAVFVAPRPRSISMAEAAALPLVAITAWEALVDRARIEPGDRVLVHAGTGGVGHVAAQLAKSRGAEVFTTVSSAQKAEVSRQYGADVAINYREETVTDYVQRYTGGAGFDVVFDTVGGDTLQNSLLAAKIGGQVVSILAVGPIDLTRAWGYKLSLHCVNMSWPLATGIGMEHHGHILRQVARLVDAGRLRPLLDPQHFSFADAQRAHAHAESGKAIGKVALVAG